MARKKDEGKSEPCRHPNLQTTTRRNPGPTRDIITTVSYCPDCKETWVTAKNA